MTRKQIGFGFTENGHFCWEQWNGRMYLPCKAPRMPFKLVSFRKYRVPNSPWIRVNIVKRNRRLTYRMRFTTLTEQAVFVDPELKPLVDELGPMLKKL